MSALEQFALAGTGSLLDAVSVPVALVDDSGCIAFANRVLREHMPLHARSMVIELFGLAAERDTLLRLQRALANNEDFVCDLPARVEGHLWRVRCAGAEQPDGLRTLTLEDVSGRRRLRDLLRASNARLDLAMAASALAMWDWNVQHDEVYYNDQWSTVLGIAPEALLRRTDLAARLLLPAEDANVLTSFERHYRGETDVFEAEYRLTTGDGAVRWFSARAKVVQRDAAGHALRVIGMLRDITRQRDSQEEANEAQLRWERAVRGTSDGLYDWNLSTGHVWYAARFREILGCGTQDFPDTFTAFQQRLHVDDRQSVMECIRLQLENRSELDVRCRLQHKNGSFVWCRLRGQAERDAAGRPRRLAGSISDISAHVEAESERRLLEAEWRQSQKMEAVGRLTGGIAHDFNNLLSVILGNMQLLVRSLQETPRLRRHAETALRAAMRGGELTRRLLAFARQQVLEPRVLDVNELLAGMYEIFRRTVASDIEIQHEFEPELSPIKADPGQLENAVLNLIINARDAMSTGGVIRLVTRNVQVAAANTNEQSVPPGAYSVVEVSDSGVGMSAEVAKRAFEPFFTTKADGKGSGLGLSMVYGFVKQSGGCVVLTSVEGTGTSVHLYFPRVDAQPSPVQLDGHGSVEVAHGTETVLVVEDDVEVRETALELLRSLGYHTLGAATGTQALELFMKHPKIALVFSDVMLPGGMLGTQLVHKLRERRPGLKVVLTSGCTDDDAAPAMMELPQGLLPKPYSLEELARRVRGALDEIQEGQQRART